MLFSCAYCLRCVRVGAPLDKLSTMENVPPINEETRVRCTMSCYRRHYVYLIENLSNAVEELCDVMLEHKHFTTANIEWILSEVSKRAQAR